MTTEKAILITLEKSTFFLGCSGKNAKHSFFIAENDDDYTPNHSRSRSRSSAAAKQARTSSQISQEQNNVAAFPQPPKERPDAKNHLKVTTEKGNHVAMSYLIFLYF